jgi:hypothetical protein
MFIIGASTEAEEVATSTNDAAVPAEGTYAD